MVRCEGRARDADSEEKRTGLDFPWELNDDVEEGIESDSRDEPSL